MVETTNSTSSGWLGVVAAVSASAAALCLVVVAAVLIWPDGSDAAATVRLEPAAAVGPDPFAESVQIVAMTTVEAPAAEAAATLREGLASNDAGSGLVATGTTPGLYGGSGEDEVCDAEQLVTFLEQNPDKAAVWASVLGISPDAIPEYVSGLTPVVLTSDTAVTNHGFRDGRATSFSAVLQAGTAVMVDDTGTPRVKCNCGNPLTPPASVDLSDAELTGDRWDGFATDQVVTVRPGDAVEELTLCNLRSGQRYTRPTGSTPQTAPPLAEGAPPSNAPPSSTSPNDAPPDGASDRCSEDLLRRAVEDVDQYIHIVEFSAGTCDGRWAAVGVIWDDGTEDAGLLEWRDGSWHADACSRYTDPVSMVVDPVVPERFAGVCLVD